MHCDVSFPHDLLNFGYLTLFSTIKNFEDSFFVKKFVRHY